MHSYAAPDIGYVEVTGTGFRVTDLVLTKFSPHQ